MSLTSLTLKGMRIASRLFLGLPKKVYRWWRANVRPKLIDYEYTEREVFFRRAFQALSFNGITGDYLEFGCAGGMTFSLAYQRSRDYGIRNHLWAFDSFCGLPPQEKAEDEHPIWQEGLMAMSLEDFKKTCLETGIPSSEFTTVAGFYNQTLRDNAGMNFPRDVCLVYIDCDLYSSTIAALEFLTTRLKHGMIIAFDDYYCWSSTAVSGERKACADYFRNNKEWALHPYVQFGWHGMSFAVEKRELDGTALATF